MTIGSGRGDDDRDGRSYFGASMSNWLWRGVEVGGRGLWLYFVDLDGLLGVHGDEFRASGLVPSCP